MITARLSYIDGSPAAGVPLRAEIISGDGSLVVDGVATSAGGLFPFYFTAGYTPGTATIRVLELATGLSAVIDILLVEAGPARIELLYHDQFSSQLALDGAILPADGTTSMAMVAKVTDLIGLPLSGVELRLEIIDYGTGWLEVFDPVSDAAGEVRFTYYAGSRTGCAPSPPERAA